VADTLPVFICTMKPSDFDYHLPPEQIATRPAEPRDASRLMVVPRGGGSFSHHHFSDLPSLLRPGDCLVINDSRVLPARLRVNRPTGGAVELLLVKPVGEGRWEAMVRPGRKVRPGMRLTLPGGAGTARVIEGESEYTHIIEFELEGDLFEFLEREGETPLPPYILRRRETQGEPRHDTPADRELYQTVYADESGSIAAPTAGLHFTTKLLAELNDRGIDVQRITLHVGLGTFEPVTSERIEDHVMHHETYGIDDPAAAAIDEARRNPHRRVVAVGTTSVRALESCFAIHGRLDAETRETNLFIHPGFQFNVIDALLTNFHLPSSSLLMLVAAFAGRESILSAYREAIERGYRFYSYGDAMFID